MGLVADENLSMAPPYAFQQDHLLRKETVIFDIEVIMQTVKETFIGELEEIVLLLTIGGLGRMNEIYCPVT